MRRQQTPLKEQYRLVMECRQSGLSDALWCQQHGIRPGTFYNWTARFRQKGCDLPKPSSQEDFIPTPHQDVVKVDIVQDMACNILHPDPVVFDDASSTRAAIKLEINGARLEIANETNPALLSQIIQLLRGTSC